ncbi:DUF3575 domain-containing protein [Flavobacterium sp. GNP002]
MKTKKLIPVLLLLFFMSAYSQSPIDKKNIVKTNLTAYIFRNYNLTYERSLTSWLSIAVSYGKIPEGEVPLLNKFLKEDDSDYNFNEAKFSNTQITIEPRFYLGKGYGHGFYLAPYYRQSKVQMDNVVYTLYIDDFDENAVPVAFSGKMTGNSFGLMLGSQWFLGKKNNWVLDFWIIGGHYGTSEGNFDGISDRVLTQDEQVQLKESLEDIDLSGAKFETTITTNNRGGKMALTGPWAGLRSGLSFGYRF